MQLPLEGIRVLDLSRLLPGPFCTQMLADLGAEVIKVEDHMGGDYMRLLEHKIKKFSVYYYTVNRNKKSIRLDLRNQEGKEIFLNLVKTADVLVEAYRPGAMERLGLGYDDLKAINPGLVYCSITGYGQDSPYKHLPGHDVNYLSVMGVLNTIGTKEGRPSIPATPFGDVAGTYNATMAILAALMGKQKNGVGQYIDIALADSLIVFQIMGMSKFMVDGINPEMGNEALSGHYAFYDVYQGKDGRYLAFGNGEEKFWAEFLKAVNREDLMADRLADEKRQQEIKVEIAEIVKTKTVAEWMEILKDYDVCITPVNNYEEALQDPHVKSRELWFYADDPVEERIPQVAFPAKFSDYKPGFRTSPPKIGADSAELLQALGYTEEQIASFKERKVI